MFVVDLGRRYADLAKIEKVLGISRIDDEDDGRKGMMKGKEEEEKKKKRSWKEVGRRRGTYRVVEENERN